MPGSVLACLWPTGRLFFLYTGERADLDCGEVIEKAHRFGLSRNVELDAFFDANRTDM